MNTIAERIFKNELTDRVPNDLVLHIGEQIDESVRNGIPLKKAIFVEVVNAITTYAGEVPATTDCDKWFGACMGIGNEVNSMMTKRYPDVDSAMIMRQAQSGATRGIIAKLIELHASYKAEVYPL